MISQLRIISYNCRGWRSSSPYVSDLLSSCDSLLILVVSRKFNVLNISDQFISTAVIGMDSSNLLVGLPFGGCAIMYRKSLLVSSPLLLTLYKRFYPVRLIDSNNSTILLINVYMPQSCPVLPTTVLDSSDSLTLSFQSWEDPGFLGHPGTLPSRPSQQAAHAVWRILWTSHNS